MRTRGSPYVLRKPHPSWVTQQQVHEAADALLKQGRRPSVKSVRGLLGHGGEHTINKYLATYWAQLWKRLQVAQKDAQVRHAIGDCITEDEL